MLLEQILELIILEFTNSLLEYLLIGLVTQISNESALLSTQQVTGTAYVKILQCKLNTASQFTETLNGLQTAA